LFDIGQFVMKPSSSGWVKHCRVRIRSISDAEKSGILSNGKDNSGWGNMFPEGFGVIVGLSQWKTCGAQRSREG